MKIVITQLPRWNKFMYFLLGFYKLEEEKILKKVEFKSDIIVNIATKTDNLVCVSILLTN